MQIELVKIQSVNEFCRLFKLQIPTRKHLGYYIDTLSRSSEFASLAEDLSEYIEFEQWCLKNGYESAKKYKLNHALPLIVDKYRKSAAYAAFNEQEISHARLRSLDNIDSAGPEDNLVSLDFKTANFYCIKKFDTSNELGQSWQELCSSLGIHEVLTSSKSFRQYMFGHLNPGRNQRIQHEDMIRFLDSIIEKGIIAEKELAFISADELVVNMGPGEVDWNKINAILDAAESLQPIKLVLKQIYKLQDKRLKLVSFPKVYKTLRKVPGNKFFINFKELVLQEELDKRDLLFEIDGEIASWETSGGIDIKLNNQ